MGLYLAILWTSVSLAGAWFLGWWGFWATALALVMAWGYSAPPFRFKQNGWVGNLAVGISYESLAWITGAAVVLGGALPSGEVLLIALLYGLGAHGIMTLNDFKSREGDLAMGVRSIPAQYGPRGAAWNASIIMLLPQLVVIGLLLAWARPTAAMAVSGLVVVQVLMMTRLLRSPDERTALWYSGFGVPVYVTGMMVTAFAL
jgi:chlorophyll synthase